MINTDHPTCHVTPCHVSLSSLSNDPTKEQNTTPHPAHLPTPNPGGIIISKNPNYRRRGEKEGGKKKKFEREKKPPTMSSLRPFHALDLFRFNLTNLDVLTENYDPSFYLQYLAKWPTLCSVMESSRGRIMGYSMFFSLSLSLSFFLPSVY